MADQLPVDTTFLRCAGIDAANGVTNINVSKAAIRQCRLGHLRVLAAAGWRRDDIVASARAWHRTRWGMDR